MKKKKRRRPPPLPRVDRADFTIDAIRLDGRPPLIDRFESPRRDSKRVVYPELLRKVYDDIPPKRLWACFYRIFAAAREHYGEESWPAGFFRRDQLLAASGASCEEAMLRSLAILELAGLIQVKEVGDRFRIRLVLSSFSDPALN
jgi:hypothetical protein